MLELCLVHLPFLCPVRVASNRPPPVSQPWLVASMSRTPDPLSSAAPVLLPNVAHSRDPLLWPFAVPCSLAVYRKFVGDKASFAVSFVVSRCRRAALPLRHRWPTEQHRATKRSASPPHHAAPRSVRDTQCDARRNPGVTQA